MKINKETLNNFRSDFTNAVKELEKKYDVVIELGNIHYSAIEFSSKIEVKNKSDIKSSQQQFADNCWCTYGKVKPEMYQKNFVAKDGKTYTLVGINPRARKNKLIIKNGTGADYCCSVDYLNL